jgi:hypothetical protein
MVDSMAILRDRNGKRIMLRPFHVFGRRPATCQTVLQSPDVSQMHALVRWHEQCWEILDQSRNGTYIGDARLPIGKWVALSCDSEIRMGEGIEAQWEVLDLDPPRTCLLPMLGEVLELLPGAGVLLPSAASPEVHIYSNEGGWVLEDAERIQRLQDGSLVTAGQMSWELVVAESLVCTESASRVPPRWDEATLRFELSQDEEHARLFMSIGTAEASDLGERIHHYLLALLARLRLRDAQRGFDASSQGWIAVDDLARLLAVDASYINIQVFRARQQIANALPAGVCAPLLVERRRGEVRLGAYTFTIRRGATLEGGLRQPSGQQSETSRVELRHQG